MSALRGLLVRLRSLVRPASVERELDEELRAHIELETERLVAGGMSLAQAQHHARRAFGNVEYLKDESRDARGVPVIENVVRDLGYAMRLARREPVFAAVVVFSLALGLGAATAVFNLTYNVLFAPLAVPRPAELTLLWRVWDTDRDVAFTRDELRAIRARPDLGTFTAIRGASQIAVDLGRTREYVNMQFVDGDFFAMLGLAPWRGRAITPADDDQRAAVAVLSADFADRLAPGDTALVGKTITIRGALFTVVGVMPRSYHGLDFPGQFTVAVPMNAIPLLQRAGSRGDDRGVSLADVGSHTRAFRIVGRVTADRATSTAAITRLLAECCVADRVQSNERITAVDIRRGITSRKDDFRGQLGTLLLILLGGMVLLVVVVCCNVASLLVVRASARAREIAVRLSLGASRMRLVSQLVLETLPLAILGGAGGVLVAQWATSALVHAVAEWDAYLDIVAFHPSASVLLFSGGATILCALGFAAYPAFRATRVAGLAQSLRIDTRASRTRGQGMVARGVVIAQVALAVVLVTTATLMALTLRNLRRVDGGFAVERVLLMSLETRGTSYEQRGTGPIHTAIIEAVRGAPGVRAAAGTSMMPLFGGSTGMIRMDVPGYVKPRSDRATQSYYVATTPGYFEAIGIPIRSGRDFGAEESARGAPAAIVSAAFVKKYFGGVDPVGRSLRVQLGDTLAPVRVVGVAADAKYMDLREAPEPIIYFPFEQTEETWSGLQIVLRTRMEPTSVAAGAMRAIDAAAPGVRIRRVSDMRARVDLAMAVQRLAAQIAAFAGLMVLALCAVGLYGVVSYGVARRTNELGIRMALGARSSAIVWLVARETARVVGVGVGAGLVLSFAASGVIASQLFGVEARDPLVMIFAVVVFAAVALIACAVPARRAARIDPCIALAAD